MKGISGSSTQKPFAGPCVQKWALIPVSRPNPHYCRLSTKNRFGGLWGWEWSKLDASELHSASLSSKDDKRYP